MKNTNMVRYYYYTITAPQCTKAKSRFQSLVINIIYYREFKSLVKLLARLRYRFHLNRKYSIIINSRLQVENTSPVPYYFNTDRKIIVHATCCKLSDSD